MALPRDAEADGSAVVDVLAAAEPPGGALRGGATPPVPWQRSTAESKDLPGGRMPQRGRSLRSLRSVEMTTLGFEMVSQMYTASQGSNKEPGTKNKEPIVGVQEAS